MVDVEALLAPVAGEDPAGPDLSYDNERAVIEQAFETSGDPDSGEQVKWSDIYRAIRSQSEKTKDIQLGVFMMRAGAKAGELTRVVEGAELLAGLMERFWENAHPKLEEYDFQGRKGPTESLTRIGEFLGPLKKATLINHPRLGQYSGDDLERYAIEGDAADGFGMFRAALAETPVEDIDRAIAELDAVRDAIQRVDVVLVANAGSDTGTNFTPTYDALKAIRRGLSQYSGVEDASEEAAAEEGGDASGGGGATAGGGFRAGQIESREDVVRALDAIADYYRRREPGSPIPLSLSRVRGWVNLDFFALLQDIAPDSMHAAKQVLSSREEGY